MTSPIDELMTVRDWLRFGVSRFSAAGLVYGHGTSTALDEAAFLILSTLNLPIDTLDPWLEARLTRGEREAVAAVFEKRIASRKPASYLVNAAYIRGHRFYVDERVIVPRSLIGELLCDAMESENGGALPGVDPSQVTRVLDLCTGSGCLAILAAAAFPDARIDATDISAEALAVAAKNISDYGLDDRIRLLQSDLFEKLRGERYDLIISNPPYVTSRSVAAFPAEYAAEPRVAHLGGDDGLDLVRRIIEAAPEHLSEDGVLVVEIGAGRELLEADYPALPFIWLDTAESSGEVFQIGAADLRSGRTRTPSSRISKRRQAGGRAS
jgi:ribosomal protein L3 glutamine methyltransferase